MIYYPTIEIPMLLFGIVLWILCCHFAKKRRETEGLSLRPSYSPSVYVIPIYEEEDDIMDLYEPYFQPPHRDPPMYSSRDDRPPPYRLEPPSYADPASPYTDPPAYSERP